MSEGVISLDDPAWAELKTAYGSASPVPGLIRDLANPQFETAISQLWSCLCHQGDVYSASFAACPHLVSAAQARADARWIEIIHLVAVIEMQRQRIGKSCGAGYRDSIEGALALCATRIADPLPDAWEAVLPAAIEAFRGHGQAADLIFRLGEIVEEDPEAHPDIKLPLFQKH